MGKTYEALKWAEKEYQANRRVPSPEPPLSGRLEPPKRVSTVNDVERYQDMKTNILTRYPDGSIKTIMFVGTAHGDGTSTTAINFSTNVARDCQLKVLLIDANLRTPSLHDVFKIDQASGLSDLVSACGRVSSPIKKVGPGNLYVIPCGGNYSEPVTLFESKRFDQFLKLVRERFNYVILDGPPVHSSAECRVLCSKVDGVVLVVESEKTRRPIALRAKMELEEAGGKILGVVLNKKRYHIPEFIYRRL
ncbi:MAG: polysaccharide biosynthesis tyrosine autokinase [Candidatus Aenigmarchaeota archaeon]|nr:polysaccharide biosynthesis tyrosine autokinase [Candidatus Aenigmarchaeota archaeon]